MVGSFYHPTKEILCLHSSSAVQSATSSQSSYATGPSMARLTIPRLRKDLTSMQRTRALLAPMSVYIAGVNANRKASDEELMKHLREAQQSLSHAAADLAHAEQHYMSVIQTLERRKAIK